MLHTKHIFLLKRSCNTNEIFVLLTVGVSPQHFHIGVTLTQAARITEPDDVASLGRNAMQVKTPS